MDKRGFLTMAIGEEYIKCAAMLARSLRLTQINITKIALVTDKITPITDEEAALFDYVIKLDPRPEVWQTRSELNFYTPFDQTMFIEADMLVPNDLSNWFFMLSDVSFAITNVVRDYRNEIYTGKHYRRFFVMNKLPDVYSGIMLWKKGHTADSIHSAWANFTSKWHLIKDHYAGHHYGQLPADEGLSLALRESGAEYLFNSKRTFPSFIHAKQDIFGTVNTDWTKNIDFTITKQLEIKLGYYRSLWPVHYQNKSLALTERMNPLCGASITRKTK